MSAQQGFAEPRSHDKGRLAAAQLRVAGTLRLPYLDGLRALASAYVVLFHALPGFSAESLSGPWRLLRRVFAYGHEAVAIFIVLSGYCLMLPAVQRAPAVAPVALGPFVKRRAKRILPPYFAALAASLALLAALPMLRASSGTIWDDSLPALDVGAVASHLLLLHNWFPSYAYQINGPLWSVATEWQIYFAFPLLLLPLWRRKGMLATLLAAAALGYAPLLLAPASARVAIPWYLLLFAFGMAAASIGFSHQQLEQRLRASWRWGRLSAVLWAGCLVLSNVAASWWFRTKPFVDPLVGLATATLLIELTQSSLSRRPNRLLALLESRSLVALGHFSYSLYLTHLPVLALFYFTLLAAGVSRAALALPLALGGGLASLLAAYAFHVVAERPFMRR